jgi:hypothetical protein
MQKNFLRVFAPTDTKLASQIHTQCHHVGAILLSWRSVTQRQLDFTRFNELDLKLGNPLAQPFILLLKLPTTSFAFRNPLSQFLLGLLGLLVFLAPKYTLQITTSGDSGQPGLALRTKNRP